MPATLIDSNVLLDLMTLDSEWSSWSRAAVTEAGDRPQLVINPVIDAEISIHLETIEEADAALPPSMFDREPLPYEAAFLAGRWFVDYRRRGGSRASPLPDFFIGAHAAVAGYRLLTRDARRYRTYSPTIELIAPTSA